MIHDERDDEMNAEAAEVARLLRTDVPVRAAWREELLARVEADGRPSRTMWQLRPGVAIAASVALIALGALGALGARVLASAIPATPPTVASAPTMAKVRFVFVDPNAAKVSIVGDFNQWNPTAVPLERLSDGTWIADVPLAPGRYAYAFVVDGKLEADPTAPRAADGDFGVSNSIVMVRGL
jgi:hypothetical protein